MHPGAMSHSPPVLQLENGLDGTWPSTLSGWRYGLKARRITRRPREPFLGWVLSKPWAKLRLKFLKMKQHAPGLLLLDPFEGQVIQSEATTKLRIEA